LTDILRNQFGFGGYVVSDSRAVEFLFDKHKVANSPKDGVRQVVEAGLDVRTGFTPPSDFILPLRELVKEGTVSMDILDRNVAHVLKMKFRLGLFDHPLLKIPKKPTRW
jgi:beta-glucosidase